MPRPKRSEQFADDEVCIVHTVQRCVRRAFLAGVDPVSGVDYSHRREWIRRRMEALASVFGVDVLTYAVMSNHLHTVLRNRPDVVAAWNDEEAATRWLRVFPGRRLEEHLAEPTTNDVATLVGDREKLASVRKRLSDISWFMRALSEPIARMANRQDDCTGRFWEGRFKCQRIVDEAGLLACSLYVDLNPIRAAMAESPERSVHTGVYDRIEAAGGSRIDSAAFDLKTLPTPDEAGKELRDTPVAELKERRRRKKRSPTGRKVARDGWLCPMKLDDQTLGDDPQVHTGGLRGSDRGYLPVGLGVYRSLLRYAVEGGKKVAEVVTDIPEEVRSTLAAVGIDASMFGELI